MASEDLPMLLTRVKSFGSDERADQEKEEATYERINLDPFASEQIHSGLSAERLPKKLITRKKTGLRFSVVEREGIIEYGYHCLAQNIWGAFEAVIFMDVPRIIDGQASYAIKLRFAYTFFLSIVNTAGQALLLFYTYFYMARPALHTMQMYYAQYRQEAFLPDGSFQVDGWNDFEYKAGLCETAYSSRLFLFAIISLWTLRCVGEFADTYRTARHLRHLKMVESVDDIVVINANQETHETAGFYVVVGSTWLINVVLTVFVIVPRCVIVLVILTSGSLCLASTVSYTDLILNALALEFIIQIDEIIYESVYPVYIRNEIAQLRIQNDEQTVDGLRYAKSSASDATRRDRRASTEEMNWEGGEDLDAVCAQLSAKLVQHQEGEESVAIYRSMSFLLLVAMWACVFVHLPIVAPSDFDISDGCSLYWADIREVQCGIFERQWCPWTSSDLFSFGGRPGGEDVATYNKHHGRP